MFEDVDRVQLRKSLKCVAGIDSYLHLLAGQIPLTILSAMRSLLFINLFMTRETRVLVTKDVTFPGNGRHIIFNVSS